MKATCSLFFAFTICSAGAFTLESKSDGAWSNAETWQPERIPKTGDEILISSGHKILYDVESTDLIHKIHVEGALVFAHEKDTELNVAVIRVGGKMDDAHSDVADVNDHKMAPITAKLEVGTPDNPIPAGITARIRLHYIDGLDKDEAPLITCRPGGRMDFHGAPMNRTWLDLGANASPGDIKLTLSQPISGWRVGDEIIITGDERDDEFTTEERRIVAINGKEITVDRPLENAHAGAGEKYRCEVANLSRNVIIESADPDGVRGHTMHHRHSAGSISYARFAHLGKKGVLGRYPIHFHLCRDSLRGESVVGAAIVDSHNRWVTIHNTQYMVVRDCVGYGSVGHGYFLEDGTEVYNILDRNLGVQAYRGKAMPDQALPFDPNDGGAFWWANGRNTFTRNTACENHEYGFRYDSQMRSKSRPISAPFQSTASKTMSPTPRDSTPMHLQEPKASAQIQITRTGCVETPLGTRTTRCACNCQQCSSKTATSSAPSTASTGHGSTITFTKTCASRAPTQSPLTADSTTLASNTGR
jgi:hypothetical protein